MKARAKFYVGEKAERANHPNPNYPVQTSETVILFPVNGGSDENKSFFQYTPSGKIELGIMNPTAAAQFEVGKEYYVDFTPANGEGAQGISLQVGASVIMPGGRCYKVVEKDGELQLERINIAELK